MTIAEQLEQYTADISPFETKRNYISLSHIHLSVEEIIDQFKTGFKDGRETRLKCYKGYQMEADLANRIKSVFGDRVVRGIEISAFDGLVKGHTDLMFDGYPADCKSVLMDEWLPKDGKLPRRIYWQMQGYMKYANKDRALVIFESRENGRLVDIWVRANQHIQSEIHDKLTEIVKQVAPQGTAINCGCV